MQTFRRQHGFALVYALIIVVVVAILAAGSIISANLSRSIAVNDRAALLAQQFAEAGINRFKTLAATSHRYVAENFESYGLPAPGTEGYCRGGSVMGLGIDLDFDHSIDIFVNQPYEFRMFAPDGTPGGYQITLASGGEQLISRGFVGPSLQDARSVSTRGLRYTQGGDLPFSYAIYVKGGFSGPAINGNVAVYGSVHSVQSDLVFDDTGLELSGTAGIYDDYFGKFEANTRIDDVVAALGGNPDIDSLCSKVMLRSGNLHIQSGAVHVGTDANNVLGVYLDEGFTITGQTQNVYVETPQLVSRYVEGPAFPELDEDYPSEDAVASVTFNYPYATGNPCNNFFREGSPRNTLRFPPVPDDEPVTCPLSDGSAIEWEPVVGSGPTAAGTLRFRDRNGQLATSDGIIINTGELDIEVGNIRYEGKGMFRAGSSASDAAARVDLNGNMTAISGGSPGGYPETSAIGFVTSGTIGVGTGRGASQLRMAALLYASGEMTVAKQTTILGSTVAGRISTGSQVPKIAYMPGIERAFPTPFPSTDGDPQVPVRVAEERR